ncbi:zinc finger MYM-type containing 1, partial [Chelydra serpentina]
HFDYEARDNPIRDHKQQFKVEFFNQVLDGAIQSVEQLFMQLKEHSSIFGMLYDIPELLVIPEEDLHQKCLALVLTQDDMCDIDASDLGDELKALSRYISAGSTPKAVLEYTCTNKLTTLFPNAFVALHILLTLPVTVASGERSFSKLKLIKTHLRATMTQERLVGLATISIEHELAQTVAVA